MHYETQQLLSGRYVLPARVLPGNLGANIDITHDGAALPDAAESERNHVGRPVVAEITMVEL
jgi:hypothetical protein